MACRCRAAQKVLLKKCALSDVTIKAIATHMTQLKELSLDDNHMITDHSLAELGNRCRSLQALSLARCELSDLGLRSLANCSQLRCLDLSQCRDISHKGLLCLAQCLVLEEGNFSGSPVGDDGIVAIVTKSGTNLRQLYLADTEITDVTLQNLGERATELLTLKLTRCHGISNAGIEALTRGCVSLSVLDLSWCKTLTDDCLPCLSTMPSLVSLSLAHCSKLTDIGLLALAGREMCLRELQLDGLHLITDVGVSYLARGIKSLRKISLAACYKLTDSCSNAFAPDVTVVTSIQTLRIVGSADERIDFENY